MDRLLASAAAIGLAVALFGSVAVQAETARERGRYLVTLMDCSGCHTTGSLMGRPDPTKYLGGAEVGWLIPNLGIVYPSNLTSDPSTGLGNWSTQDIVKLLRTGITPEGRMVAPIMPWRAYGQASDADLEAIADYLKSVPAVKNEVPGPTALAEVKTPYFTAVRPGQ